MNRYIEILKQIIPNFTKEFLEIPFRDIGIDSIDLVTIRVQFEKVIKNEIQEQIWYSFKNFSEVINYCISIVPLPIIEQNFSTIKIQKQYKIGMPQMTNYGLSENWLFKELGDLHWQLITKGLGIESSELFDDFGNRLYATFIRIRLNISSLKNFNENAFINFDGELKRYGNKTFISSINCQSNNNAVNAELITNFSIRNTENNINLSKVSIKNESAKVQKIILIPELLTEYQLIRKGLQEKISLSNFEFELTQNIVFETVYKINPYYDLNGVGLLYFAAYPTINDFCENEYFKTKYSDWVFRFYTIARDILYFGNCDFNDTIIYQLNEFEFINDETVKIASSLYRKIDNKKIAQIFTIKKHK